jgi:superfamily II DNA or RNA helicase
LATAIYTIDSPGSIVEMLVKVAYRKLLVFRENDPDAAMLILCGTQEHAEKVSNQIGQWLRIHPILAISDYDDSHAKIEDFRISNDPILVSVKMVTEGIDIPRIRIVVLITVVTTELFFRQAIGRALRIEDKPEDQTASIYIIADPRLISMASMIQEEREIVVQEILDEEEGDRQKNIIERKSSFRMISSEGIEEGFVANDGTIYTCEEQKQAEEIKLQFPGMRSVTNECIAELLRIVKSKEIDVKPLIVINTADERRNELRSKINRAVRSACFNHTELKYPDVHVKLNNSVGIRTIREGSVEQLEKMLKTIKSFIETGKWSI